MESGKPCGKCDGATYFHYGLKGKNADERKLLFVLHRPDDRIAEPAIALFDQYESALLHSDTGKNLSRLLRNCGIGWEDIYLTNVYKCVLEKNRAPSPEEYQNCLDNQFDEQLGVFNPRKMILFGQGTAKALFPEMVADNKFEQLEGVVSRYRGWQCLILPHASKMESSRVSSMGLVTFYETIRKFIR
jgi:hypothetical protein